MHGYGVERCLVHVGVCILINNIRMRRFQIPFQRSNEQILGMLSCYSSRVREWEDHAYPIGLSSKGIHLQMESSGDCNAVVDEALPSTAPRLGYPLIEIRE